MSINKHMYVCMYVCTHIGYGMVKIRAIRKNRNCTGGGRGGGGGGGGGANILGGKIL